MQRRQLIAAATLLGAVPGATAQTVARTRTGTAYDKDSGIMLYRETHRETFDGGRLVADQISFSDNAGRRFASKQVSFPGGAFVPDFQLENQRNGHLEACRQREDGTLAVSFRQLADKDTETKRLEAPEGALADAGFDRFIEAAWDELRAGGRPVRPFLVPSLFRFIDFRLRLDGEDDARNSTRFAMEIDSTLMRLLAPTIYVDYDRDTRRLLRYEGPSNMRDGEGDNLNVVIDFAG